MATIDDPDFVSPNSIPADTLQLAELKKHLQKLVTEGYLFEKLEKAPVDDVPGCDDHANRFQWWRRYDPQMNVEGYFHTPKGFEISD